MALSTTSTNKKEYFFYFILILKRSSQKRNQTEDLGIFDGLTSFHGACYNFCMLLSSPKHFLGLNRQLPEQIESAVKMKRLMQEQPCQKYSAG